MVTNQFRQTPSHLRKKAVRVLLRDGHSLEGTIHIPEGLPLLNFLGIKRFFLNLTQVKRIGAPGEEGPIEHLSLRISNVVWVIPLDPSLHITTALPLASASRKVELQLVDGLNLKVDLNIAEEQRMSDYLDANLGFVPLWSAEMQTTSQVFERMAVNHEAILAIRELRSE